MKLITTGLSFFLIITVVSTGYLWKQNKELHYQINELSTVVAEQRVAVQGCLKEKTDTQHRGKANFVIPDDSGNAEDWLKR
ncbi:TPA: hypothetical protein OT801_003744 [Morganella morganii]|uniref:Uncharacterized protein n=2 Tax=Morganellaceae TaxID=1903414 RepID=A0AAE4FFW2_MORMO|nr:MULTISPECIES: hypothetical protein [Enterobacterales]EAP4395321.1 hypothetical protein [Salmonella enterica]ECM0800555.1 hypothetical protein [Salmonella enterica subsp. enterica serovar Enteritidis]EFP7242558.1 hypothetical protein [Shigella flexneri]EFT9560160.1 hypothetical protein [Salmonella enterica subsp. enterica]EJR0218707.1 hypothetical protein [Klebsiella pneumoniae]CAF2613934.1 hypothetical protein AI2866V1_4608 [Enterobacter cloacae]HBC0578945.1 hypothetical protein [Serratia